MNKISKKYKFDVVHWHVARIYPFFFLLPTKITIVTIHDAGNYILDNVMNLSNWIFRFNYELFQNKIKKFIVVSNDAKANLVRYSKISEDKISVIYPASRINQVRKEPPADFYDIPKDSNIILCVARWQNHKNVESLIRAYEKFNCDFPDCHLLLVGKEVGTYDLPRKLLKSIPTTRYSVMSDLSDSELAFLYSKAYVNVVPSLHEGFGLSVLEAMMFGCPSIVHKFTSTSEIAGPAGLSVDMRSLFELKSALESILNNEELRTALSQASLIHSKNFSWNYFSNQVLQIYRTPE